MHRSDDCVPSEMLKRSISGRSSHPFPQGIIYEELKDCFGQSVRIIPLDPD